MDDLVTNNSNSSNSNSSITSGSTTIATNTSQQIQNGLSYYEIALKKLNHILKSKASDVGKQLEDLWDSINQSNNNNNNTTSTAISTNTNGHQKGVVIAKPVVGGGAAAVVNGKNVNSLSGRVTSLGETNAQEATNTLKRDASKLSTNTLTTSATSESLAKKTKVQASSSSSSSTITVKPLVASSKSTTATNSSASKSQSTASKTNTTTSQKTLGKSGAPFTSNSKKASSPNLDTIDDTHSSSSSSSTISNSSSRASKIPSPPLVTNLNGTFDSNVKGSTHVGFNLLTEGDVVDMLEFSCCICNQFNQELNNKLIECKKCTKLYHQSCHVPHIENKDIEAASNGDRLAECSLCKSALKSPPLSAKIVSASQQKIYPFEEECTRMEASSNENKISINFNSKITNNNNSNNLIEISNNKVSNSVGVIQENTNISNNLNSAQTNSIPETESINSNSNTNANTNNTSNLNGNTAKFFKRELPKIESKESLKASTNSNSSHIEISLTKPESIQDISQQPHTATTINNNNISSNNNNNNNSAPKGFAALANKFNSNGGSASIKTPSSSNSSSGSSLPTSNGKVNHDDLFKKFRQSVNTNSSSSSSSSTNLNKVFTHTEKTPQQSTPASSLINKPVINNSTSNNIIQQKRNIFNTPNNLTNANDTVKKSNLVNTVKL